MNKKIKSIIYLFEKRSHVTNGNDYMLFLYNLENLEFESTLIESGNLNRTIHFFENLKYDYFDITELELENAKKIKKIKKEEMKKIGEEMKKKRIDAKKNYVNKKFNR